MKNNQKPIISVVMPVYNAGGFLVEAIESILRQSYHRFEFIIVDDASTDGSWRIMNRYAKRDSRIQIYRNQTNQGVSKSMRKALSHVTTKFVARMDGDDIADSHRLEKQLKYLRKNKETIAVGGQCIVIDEKGRRVGMKNFPLSFEDIQAYIFTFIPVQQPTLMIALKRLPEHVILYENGYNTAEEVELLFKLFSYGKVENMPDVLLKYRVHSQNTSFANIKQTFLLTLLSRIKAVAYYGYRPTVLGIFNTFLQTLLILVLPERSILWLYQNMRRSTPFFTLAKYHSVPANERLVFE